MINIADCKTLNVGNIGPSKFQDRGLIMLQRLVNHYGWENAYCIIRFMNDALESDFKYLEEFFKEK